MKTHLTHARIILADEVIEDGSLLIEDGLIQAICPEVCGNAHQIPLHSQWLMPGMVDLHCDAIEKECEPRAKVLFPHDFACVNIDRRNAAAGITTPFHALSFAHAEWGVRNNDTASEVVRALKRFKAHELVDNRIHVRYEITDISAMPYILTLLEEGCVDLLSIMDHTPGQGQFKHLETYIAYMMGNHGSSREAAETIAEEKRVARETADERVLAVMAKARELGIPTASHDDDEPLRVATMKELGATMSEFPINLETARAAHKQGLSTILGAPNVMRGSSQSGNMRALDAILDGVADCLCADYAPATMLAAVAALHTRDGLPLHQAARLVTSGPARAAGLLDRGEIAVGKRADLVSVGHPGGHATITSTWVSGRQVFAVNYPQ
ncbi:alpha-D-ribose 1-methylphosphonate 5-triphosphate diphosphatase [Niveibacterium sp. 24ML]|uniref:alpha-D-ribose 1-methylphosphonate 5-triphosphate diphosphatase n=1 Tax=Niveibacterium sp. 24ML TaxID=2985512 RepID=UPI002271924E|nr:alpha-D-ribose 1-methylphosphonate 5-triphosphate diphosphatase [Niveibacterium sp. 24ML]MCX9156067.1 alpha-D-ribose 1-methylphosphonate 5-triphosphate diphosphatase [Niveibacterium sp. 24ML]